MGVDVPSGTVTFLFTDIEGSSQLWENHPAVMPAALARHDQLLRGAIAKHRGVVFSTGGDGLAAVFARARDAVDAAVEAQTALRAECWPDPVVVRARMALHTGEADERDGDYFGPAVNRAARLMALADGGEVLVSLATAEMVGGQLTEGVELVGRGEHQLRSLSKPERVLQVVWPGSGPVRPLLIPRVGNLPRVERPLVGRDGDAAAVSALIDEAPLVTLTGVGGVGKTSLALAVARRRADDFADGAWFCELAGVRDPAGVADAVAETLGLRPQAGLTPAEMVVRGLAAQDVLVVLDNCEHVIDEAAALAEQVAGRCDRVRVLATSREGLGVSGERLVAVRPLEPIDALQLLRQRVGEHRGGFDADDADDVLLAQVCRQLDGLPLAIELAAARAHSMGVAELAGRLGERFRLLRGQRRAVERHQTLRATVAWSYELLTENERRLFARLSSFAGGFDLAAAEAVCAGEDLDRWDVDELVVSLVDKSMVVTGERGRYLLLETLRQFGEEQLEHAGASARLRDRHLAYFTGFAKAAHDGLQGGDQAAWLQRLHDDWANLRAAFNWAAATGDVDAAATIAVHLVWPAIWHDTGEPLVWVTTAAQLPGAPQSRLWPSLLAGQAWAAWDRGDMEAALDLGHRALTAEPFGEPIVDYLAHMAIQGAAQFLQRDDVVEEYVGEGVRLARKDGRAVHESIFTVESAIHHLAGGRFEQASRTARRGLALGEAVDNPNAIAFALGHEGIALAALHDPTAEEVLTRGLAVASESGSTLAVLVCERELAVLLSRSKQTDRAARLVLHGLQTMRRKASWMFASQTLGAAVGLLAVPETGETAAVLYGAFRKSAAVGFKGYERIAASLSRRLAAILGAERLEQLAGDGEHLPVEQAVSLAENALAAMLTD